MSEVVLIVDDDAVSLELVRDLLDVAGFRTLEAQTAEECVALARAYTPRLILMDIQLPDGNGLAVLGRLRADGSTSAIPVVALTAQAMPNDGQRFLRAGFDGYLSKPIDTRALAGQVRGFCAGANKGGS
jgi:CheY-like chemotaxis protein